MSGRNLAGITSVARTESAVQIASPRAGEADTNGAAVEDVDRRASASDADRPRAGLPSYVIHELRTPLTSIHGYAQVLQRSLRDNPRATNALGVVVRETTRLSEMLASLSELAELQSGETFSPPIDVDVYQLVEGIAHEVTRQDGGAHPIHLEGDGRVLCDPTLLGQAVLHVLGNAALYSPEGERISVAVEQSGNDVEIVVTDRGIGVLPGDRQRIYEPFERGANARQAGCRGLGLGLFLAREALARTRGRIDHRARDGGGTTFRMTVPRA